MRAEANSKSHLTLLRRAMKSISSLPLFLSPSALLSLVHSFCLLVHPYLVSVHFPVTPLSSPVLPFIFPPHFLPFFPVPFFFFHFPPLPFSLFQLFLYPYLLSPPQPLSLMSMWSKTSTTEQERRTDFALLTRVFVLLIWWMVRKETLNRAPKSVCVWQQRLDVPWLLNLVKMLSQQTAANILCFQTESN